MHAAAAHHSRKLLINRHQKHLKDANTVTVYNDIYKIYRGCRKFSSHLTRLHCGVSFFLPKSAPVEVMSS